ncbi:MAG: monovalent cation/H+ antiporter complex subunit F [Bowdeniella nasicola]|nr:monovalent cation/H+ antiporter complex subunit F [Bowdeniella nasicola]
MRLTNALETVVSGLEVASFLLIVVAAVVVLIRMMRGPSMLDRAVAMDVITSAMIGAVAVWSALRGRTDLIPALIALAMVGFIGTTTIARFVVIDNPEEARILSELQEEHERDEPPIDDEAEPVHDPDRVLAEDSNPNRAEGRSL